MIATATVAAAPATTKVMNLRENDEKCFMSNNRKYISLFFFSQFRDEKMESVQKIYGRERVADKKLLANDITIQFLCIM